MPASALEAVATSAALCTTSPPPAGRQAALCSRLPCQGAPARPQGLRLLLRRAPPCWLLCHHHWAACSERQSWCHATPGLTADEAVLQEHQEQIQPAWCGMCGESSNVAFFACLYTGVQHCIKYREQLSAGKLESCSCLQKQQAQESIETYTGRAAHESCVLLHAVT